MKIILVVGLIVLVLLMTMNVKEGFSDSDIDNDIGKFNNIKSAASTDTQTLAMKDMKINTATMNDMQQLITKYNDGDDSKKVTSNLTVDQAIQKLNHRKSSN